MQQQLQQQPVLFPLLLLGTHQAFKQTWQATWQSTNTLLEKVSASI